MKRTTYIMFTLIIGGVVLIASLFSLVKFTGEPCDESWRNGPLIISGTGDSVQLPEFNMLDIKYSYDAKEGQDMSIYVRNGMHVVLSVDSTATEPYVFLPETFAEYATTYDDQGRLQLELVFPNRFCEFKDSVSSAVRIMIPASMSGVMRRVKCHNDVSTHFIVEALNGEDIDFTFNDNVNLYLNYCLLKDVTVQGNDYINVYGSGINRLEFTGVSESDVICTHGTEINEVCLKGNGVNYNLTGVEDYKVYPDSASMITVTQVYR